MISVTRDEPQMSRPPMGAKMMPIMKRVGRMVLGVRMRVYKKDGASTRLISHDQSSLVPTATTRSNL